MKNLIILVLICSTFLGCGKAQENADETPILKAYRLIDENRLDEAIALLSDELVEKNNVNTKNNDEIRVLRVTLASAYAKKSGITIREIAHSIELGQQVAKTNAEFNGTLLATVGLKDDKILTNLIQLILSFQKISKTLSVIPTVTEAQIPFLVQAIKILDVTAELKSADRIYYVVLQLIYFKTILSSKEFSDSAPRVVIRSNQCMVDLYGFKKLIEKLGRLSVGIFENLIQIYPEQQEKYKSDSEKILSTLNAVASLSATSYLVYNQGLFSLESIYLMLGLPTPNNPKCEADDDF